jgi:hypothetical protein
MGRFIRASISLARAKRRFSELLGWEAAEDIHADVVVLQQKVCQSAYSAEQADLLAQKDVDDARADLEAALGDGRLDNSDMPRVLRSIERLKKAVANIGRSARHDHNISEHTQTS